MPLKSPMVFSGSHYYSLVPQKPREHQAAKPNGSTFQHDTPVKHLAQSHQRRTLMHSMQAKSLSSAQQAKAQHSKTQQQLTTIDNVTKHLPSPGTAASSKAMRPSATSSLRQSYPQPSVRSELSNRPNTTKTKKFLNNYKPSGVDGHIT